MHLLPLAGAHPLDQVFDLEREVLVAARDVLFFLEETTPARSNPLTRKRHGIKGD